MPRSNTSIFLTINNKLTCFFEKDTIFVNSLTFLVYVYFLSISFGLTPFYVLPVIFRLFFKLDPIKILKVLPLLYLLDTSGSWPIPTEYGNYSFYTFFKPHFATLRLFLIQLAALIFFSLTSYLVFVRLLPKSKNKLLIPAAIFIIAPLIHFVLLFLMHQTDYKNPLFAFFVLTLSMFAKKIWLLVLALQTTIFKKQMTYYQFTQGIFTFSPFSREVFDLNDYTINHSHLKKYAVLGCLFAISFFYFMKLFSLPEYHSDLKVCSGNVSMSVYLSYATSPYLNWYCLTIASFLKGIVKHLLIDTLLLVIPGYLIGLNFTFPFQNFFKSRSFADFFSNTMYYYSLVVNRFFIWELHKAANIFKLPLPKKVLIFLSVFFAGIYFHLYRDIHYVFIYGMNFFPKLFNGPIFYYLLLGFFISFKLKIFKSKYSNIAFWFILMIFIRYINAFYMLEDISLRIKFLKMSLLLL